MAAVQQHVGILDSYAIRLSAVITTYRNLHHQIHCSYFQIHHLQVGRRYDEVQRSGIDRIIRGIVGLVIIAGGIYFKSWWGAIGLAPLFTVFFDTAQSTYRLRYLLARRDNVSLISKNTSKVLTRSRRTSKE